MATRWRHMATILRSNRSCQAVQGVQQPQCQRKLSQSGAHAVIRPHFLQESLLYRTLLLRLCEKHAQLLCALGHACLQVYCTAYRAYCSIIFIVNNNLWLVCTEACLSVVGRENIQIFAVQLVYNQMLYETNCIHIQPNCEKDNN